ncbi:MAG: DUF2341 domain-containing protein [Cytophagaceae bacterium]
MFLRLPIFFNSIVYFFKHPAVACAAFFLFNLCLAFQNHLFAQNGNDGNETSVNTESLEVSGNVSNALCYGSADGEISFNISGGTLPYTFNWSNGVSGSIRNNCFNTISITNTDIPLSDFQVRVNLDFYAGMSSDFSNVRFSDTSGVTLYDYWVERVVEQTSAVFWVKIPSVPEGISYMKVSYCNPEAVSLSNGYATFDFFEDFDQGTLDWTFECQNRQAGESCEGNLSTAQFVSPENSLRLNASSSCGTTTNDGLINIAKKTIVLSPGQYQGDVSTRHLVCLQNDCEGSIRLISRMYYGENSLGGHWVRRRNSCGCNYTNWFEARLGSFESTGEPEDLKLYLAIEDCGTGSLWQDNVRIRKFSPSTPVVVVGPPQYLTLSGLAAGEYSINVSDANGNIFSKNFIVEQPELPVGVDGFACEEGSVLLTASGQYNTFRWYATTESESVLGEAEAFLSEVLDSSTDFYVSGVGINSCESFPRVKVMAEINPIPAMPEVFDTIRCGPGQVKIVAQGSADTYNWYGNAEEESPLSSGSTFLTPHISDSGTFYVSSLSKGCESEKVRFNVYVKAVPQGTLEGNNVVLPGESSGVVNLDLMEGEFIRWEVSHDSLFSNMAVYPESALSFFKDNMRKTTYFRAVIGSGFCPDVYSNTVRIRVNIPPECNADTAYIYSGAVLTSDFSLLDNDRDHILEPLQIVPVYGYDTKYNGNIDVDQFGFFTYASSGDFIGVDSINYKVCDIYPPRVRQCSSCPLYLIVAEEASYGMVVYTGISPNGDMLNDEWIIEGIEKYPHNRVSVFDRWGSIVFETNAYDNQNNVWYGNSNKGIRSGGDELPSGTYFYVIELEEGKRLSGYVVLSR